MMQWSLKCNIGEKMIHILKAPFDQGGGEKSIGAREAPHYIQRYLKDTEWHTAENGKTVFFTWHDIKRDSGLFNEKMLSADIKKRVSGMCPDFIIGGDNSISMAGYRAMVDYCGGPVILIHADAHPDCRDPAMIPAPDPHASWVRHLIEEKVLDPDYYFLFGCRANDRRGDAEGSEYDYLNRLGIFGTHVYPMYKLDKEKYSNFTWLFFKIFLDVSKLKKNAKGIYCAFDIDVLDPFVAPGTGCTASGGWNFRQARTFLEAMCSSAQREKLPMMGDITEINPEKDMVDLIGRLQTIQCAGDLLREWASFLP